MNAIAHLESQHSDIENLFYELGLAKDDATKSLILAELGANLVAHAASERRLNAALMAKYGDEGLAASWKKQGEAEDIIAALLEIDPSEGTFAAQIAHLQDVFESRVEHEETELFPRIRGLIECRGLADREDRSAAPLSAAPLTALSAA